MTREISEPGGHASTSASPPSNVSYAVAHSSVARHAGDGEPVCDGETVAVPVRVAVRERVRDGERLADTEGGPTTRRVLVRLPEGAPVRDAVDEDAALLGAPVRLAVGDDAGEPD